LKSEVIELNSTCKLCEEPLPVKALHFSNEIAITHGYCCYMCMLGDLGNEKALAILQENNGKPKREG